MRFRLVLANEQSLKFFQSNQLLDFHLQKADVITSIFFIMNLTGCFDFYSYLYATIMPLKETDFIENFCKNVKSIET